MKHHFLDYKSSVISYYKSGNGPETLFCFHGYGQNGSYFSFLTNKLGKKYTLYAIDFPEHGKTVWNEKHAFTPEDLIAIMQLIHADEQHKFSILAYSLGGRAAMHLLQQIPGKIKRIALVAPDGLHQNIWYWFATQTAIGSKMFNYTMYKPAWLLKSIKRVEKTGLLSESVVEFVYYHLNNRHQRILLYKRWMFMRKLKPDLPQIKKICAEQNVKLNFLFGKFDRIILSKRAAIFRQIKNISIKVIDAGHSLLNEKYTNDIAALLND